MGASASTGLLYDSDPDAEEEETRLKASAFLDALRRPRGVEVGARVEAPRFGAGRRVLLVDHQDSFVHTLANYLRQTGAQVTTRRAGFPSGVLDDLRPNLHAERLRSGGDPGRAPAPRDPDLQRLPRAAGPSSASSTTPCTVRSRVSGSGAAASSPGCRTSSRRMSLEGDVGLRLLRNVVIGLTADRPSGSASAFPAPDGAPIPGRIR